METQTTLIKILLVLSSLNRLILWALFNDKTFFTPGLDCNPLLSSCGASQYKIIRPLFISEVCRLNLRQALLLANFQRGSNALQTRKVRQGPLKIVQNYLNSKLNWRVQPLLFALCVVSSAISLAEYYTLRRCCLSSAFKGKELSRARFYPD